MHELSIPDANLTLYIPENANECTPEQYSHLLTLYPQLIAGQISPEQFRIRLAYRFLRMKPSGRNKQKMSGVPSHQKLSNLWRVAQLFDGFLSLPADGSPQLNISTIRQFYPRVKHRGHIYHGAADALTSFTFLEFIHADVAARKYAESNDPAQLALLTALIYRKQKPWGFRLFGDKTYVPQSVEAQAAKHPLPAFYQTAALNLYQSTLQWWGDGPIEINGTEVDLRLLWSNSGKTATKGSLTTVLFSLAESGVFGTVKQTSQANLYDVLLRLYQVAQQAKEAQQKAKEKPKAH